MNVRKNQWQVDVLGNTVGMNRPDLQYDLGGVHYNVEFDTDPAASLEHFSTIFANDPASSIDLIF